jgi:Uma2 family endonuclease
MVTTPRTPPPSMTVADFIAWPGDGTGRRYQLIDGEARVISPGSVARAIIHTTLACLVAEHLKAVGSPYSALIRPPVVPRVRAIMNLRTPAIGVTAAPDHPDRQYDVADPILLIEVLTPETAFDIRRNVRACRTIPSVREIAVVHATHIMAETLSRRPDGRWPEKSEDIGSGGSLSFKCIEFSCPLIKVYAQTHLGDRESS